MNRATVVRAVLAFAILALSVFYALTKPPRLGLDLAAEPRSCSKPATPRP